jgi:hypothetical protein
MIVPITGTTLVRDTKSMALINQDKNGLDDYLKKRNLMAIQKQEINNTKETTLSFSQQVEEYRYMITFWTPSPKMSYMQYLSEIALRMVLDISQYMYYLGNNLEPCFIYQKKYYKNNFNSERAFRIYIFKYFSNINKKYLYHSN